MFLEEAGPDTDEDVRGLFPFEVMMQDGDRSLVTGFCRTHRERRNGNSLSLKKKKKRLDFNKESRRAAL